MHGACAGCLPARQASSDSSESRDSFPSETACREMISLCLLCFPTPSCNPMVQLYSEAVPLHRKRWFFFSFPCSNKPPPAILLLLLTEGSKMSKQRCFACQRRKGKVLQLGKVSLSGYRLKSVKLAKKSTNSHFLKIFHSTLTMNSQAGGGLGHHREPMRGSYWGCPGTDATTCQWTLAHTLPAWWKPQFCWCPAKATSALRKVTDPLSRIFQNTKSLPGAGVEPYIHQQMEILLPPSHLLSWLKSFLCLPGVPLKAAYSFHQGPFLNFQRQRGFPQDHPWNSMKLSSPNKWMSERMNESLHYTSTCPLRTEDREEL